MTPTDQELNIAVAVALGRHNYVESNTKFNALMQPCCDVCGKMLMAYPELHTENVPDYGADLNAMNQAERYAKEHLMNGDQWEEYGEALEKIHPSACLSMTGVVGVVAGFIDYGDFATLMTETTAAQRRECLLKVLNLYPSTEANPIDTSGCGIDPFEGTSR